MAEKETTKKKDSGNMKTSEQVFSKEQLKNSKKFANRKDLIEVLLEEGRQYSISEVEEKIEKFMKGKVD